MRRRRLTAEETAMWLRVARTVTPLTATVDVTAPEAAAKAEAEAARPAAISPPRRAAAPASPPPGPAPVDRRTSQRLKRGQLPIDATFDLHGHTQATAHDALERFLSRARARGWRHVLIVTGRGVDGDGVLKRAVPRWFEEPGFRRLVAAFQEAGPRHGGAGALYVVLRGRRQG